MILLVLLAMTIKRKFQTKYKLPTLNWIALKPNQVKGTIFSELDDDKLFNVSNTFYLFSERVFFLNYEVQFIRNFFYYLADIILNSLA